MQHKIEHNNTFFEKILNKYLTTVAQNHKRANTGYLTLTGSIMYADAYYTWLIPGNLFLLLILNSI